MYNQNFFNPYQQQLQNLEQNYPRYVQPQVNNVSQGVQVSNVDEANAFRVDPLGTPTFFYNAGKNEIYLKRTNQTGLTDFFVFKNAGEPLSEVKKDLDVGISKDDFKALCDKVDGIYAMVTPKRKKGEQDVE